MPVLATGSAPAASGKPKESRRWLKPRVPKEQLFRLAPAPRPRTRLGAFGLPDRIRDVIRAWWAWLIAALVLEMLGWRLTGWIAGAMTFVLYHSSTDSHPAVYALEPDFDTASDEFRSTIAGATGMPLVPGNRVEIYNNGDEFYPAMLDAIESARLSITMEQYIFWDGQVGRRFAEAFAEKAREGIPVKLLVDAIGSATLGHEIFQILAAGGCQLAWFRPIHWYTLHRANQRDHRKSLIVDGAVAFTGGAGLGDHWLGSAENETEWRDIQVRVEGPAVAAQQAGFAQNWLLTTGEIIGGHEYFVDAPAAGSVPIQTILSSPSSGAGAAGTMYLIAIQCARRYLYIANPYFIPDPRVIDMLARACRRGVNVKLMLAGRHNDTWWARQNSVRLYGALLDAGVELYEYQPSMLHQKTMIVDGAWATIGTTNFDNRSFALSEETNVCFHEAALVEQLRQIFSADLARCERVELATWKKRGLYQQSKEILASLIENQV
ncbi:MAG: cardiolipin synthase B [Acidobacteriia bacterium]|nr:cardiolipin synthase B [Terriglobia bacterium]